MNKTVIGTIFSLIAIAIVGFFAGMNVYKQMHPAIGNKGAVEADTVFVFNTRTDTLPGEPYLVPVKEKVNIDSLWQEAKQYALDLIYRDRKKSNNPDTLNNYKFMMVSDTTFQDSTFSERIKFISPIPLHPRSYFTRDVTWKERLILQPVVKEESFWSRFSWGLQAGIGYGVIHGQLDMYVGAGGSFKIK